MEKLQAGWRGSVNMRGNVGKWNVDGGINVTKVRLAYYYNGFDA